MFRKLKAGDYTLPHPIWSKKETEDVTPNHRLKLIHLTRLFAFVYIRKPKGLVDWTAYTGVSTLRLVFDLLSGYKLPGQRFSTD